MSGDKIDSSDLKWKDKYLNSVERLKSSHATIELLQKCVLRVSLAADGQNKKLDTELAALREAIRSDASDTHIGQLLDTLSQTLLELENEKESNPLIKTLSDLIKPLEQTRLPDDLDKRLKAFERQLAKAGSSDKVDEIVSAYTNLIRDTFQSAFGEIPESEFELDTVKPGILKRLFIKETRPEESNTENGIEHISDSVRDTLLNLLNHLILPKTYEDRALEIVKDLKRGLTLDRLPETLDRIVSLVVDSASEENHGFEDFLQSISERLQELHDYLASIGVGSDETLSLAGVFNQEMINHVNTIRESFQSTHDITLLKKSIDTQLNTIMDRVDTFCQDQTEKQNEFRTRIQSLQERLETTEKESAELREHLVVQRARAQLDALTKLPNRQAYDHQLSAEYNRWLRYRKPLSLMILDIDFFKKINDTFGHAAGDKVLKTVARVLQANIRETDYIFRFGGEEFVMLMPETTLDAAKVVAEKLRLTIQNCPFHSNNVKVPVTFSIGIAEFDGNDETQHVFERADKALYQAKQNGRNRVECSWPASTADEG